MARIQLSDIKEICATDDWEVISTSYKNLNDPMEFKCACGHLVIAPWKKIREKRRCPICAKNVFVEQDETVIPKLRGAFRILALDQATKRSGYAIFDNGKLIKFGVFDAEKFGAEVARISAVRHWLINMIENWKIDYIGLEGIQLEKNFGVEVFASLARLQGTLINTIFEAGLPHLVCHTATWRNHCGVKGRSRADCKTSMRRIAKELYGVNVSDDESDAIGIGLYTVAMARPHREIVSWE